MPDPDEGMFPKAKSKTLLKKSNVKKAEFLNNFISDIKFNLMIYLEVKKKITRDVEDELFQIYSWHCRKLY